MTHLAADERGDGIRFEQKAMGHAGIEDHIPLELLHHDEDWKPVMGNRRLACSTYLRFRESPSLTPRPIPP